MKPKLEINKIYIPKIAKDLFVKILRRRLYTIKDVTGIVKNKERFGKKIKSIPEKK